MHGKWSTWVVGKRRANTGFWMLLVIVAKAYPGLEEPHLAFFPICLKTYTTGHPPQLCLNMTMAHFHQELLKIKFLTVRPKPPTFQTHRASDCPAEVSPPSGKL